MPEFKRYIEKSILILFLLMFSGILSAQYKLKDDQSTLTLKGKATQHKWSASADAIDGSLNVTLKDDKIADITWFEVNVTSKQIHSGKSGMDERMYKALKTDSYPKITFKNTSEKIEGNKLTLTGNLTIAGVTKTITTIVDYKFTDGKIQMNGIFTVKMTDYNIDPPEFMFGALKTGDDVIIKFSLTFQHD